MEILNMLYSCDKSSSHKEYFSSFQEQKFFLFDGNSHIEIKYSPEWNNGFK